MKFFSDSSKQLNAVMYDRDNMNLTDLGNKTLGLLQGIEKVKRNHSTIRSTYQAIVEQYKEGSTEGLGTTTLDNLSTEAKYLNRVKNGVEDVKDIRDDFQSAMNQDSDLGDVASELSGSMQMLVDLAESEIERREELIEDMIDRLQSRESDSSSDEDISLSDEDIQDIKSLAERQPGKREVVEEVRTGLERSVQEFAETTLRSSHDIDALNKVSQSPAAFMASVQTAVSEENIKTYQELYQTVLEHGFAGANPDEAAFWALLTFYGLAGYLLYCVLGLVADYAVTGDDPFIR